MSKIDPTTLAVSQAMTKQTRRIAFLEEANAASHKHCDELQADLTAARARIAELERENERLYLALLKANGAQTKATTVDQ